MNHRGAPISLFAPGA